MVDVGWYLYKWNGTQWERPVDLKVSLWMPREF